MTGNTLERFLLTGKSVIVTGAAGLLGQRHVEAIAEAGGNPILLDLHQAALDAVVEKMRATYPGAKILGLACDITKKSVVETCLGKILEAYGRIDGLVNNAANDPKVGPTIDAQKMMRFENLSEDHWQKDIAVGLTGAFLCAQVFGHYMATHGGGVIVNVASDLGVIAPDQRIYRQPGVAEDSQPVKPVTYSVVKTGLIGLTRYLATYWAEANVRVNAMSPGGVYNGQGDAFVQKLTQLIPMGRMADKDEYKATMLYLLSDASSFMTGANLVVDGGRTCW